jgi:hypothetical protein
LLLVLPTPSSEVDGRKDSPLYMHPKDVVAQWGSSAALNNRA